MQARQVSGSVAGVDSPERRWHKGKTREQHR